MDIKLQSTNDQEVKVVINKCGDCQNFEKNLKGMNFCRTGSKTCVVNGVMQSLDPNTKACALFKNKNRMRMY